MYHRPVCVGPLPALGMLLMNKFLSGSTHSAAVSTGSGRSKIKIQGFNHSIQCYGGKSLTVGDRINPNIPLAEYPNIFLADLFDVVDAELVV